jgi:hypothetical protein
MLMKNPMAGTSINRHNAPVWRVIRLGLAIIGISFAGGCAKTANNLFTSIKIEREVTVAGFRHTLAAMARTDDDHFYIVGHADAAWLAVIDANGHVLSRYDEPLNATLRSKEQSQFLGVLVLGERVLACGLLATTDGMAALLAVFNRQGDLLEHRVIRPHDDPGIYMSGFKACIPWGDGVALSGTAYDGQKTSRWIVKLRADLSKQWESTDSKLAGGSINVLPDQSLLQASNGGSTKTDRSLPLGRYHSQKAKLSAHRRKPHTYKSWPRRALVRMCCLR